MRKLFLVAATALAAMAFASPAMATESVSVVTEPGGAACTTSTCNTGISNSGSIELRGHVFGFESHSLDCNNTYTLNVGSNGSGNISSFAFGQGDAECVNISACATPWAFSGEETAANTGQLDVAMCVDGTPLGECEGTISITLVETATNHRYSGSVNDGSLAGESFGKCEVTGSWVQSGTINGFEIVHQ